MVEKVDMPPAPKPPDPDDTRAQEILDDTVERLRAHFKHVLIITAYPSAQGDDYFMASRSDDYFAVKGLCHYWLDDDNAVNTSTEVAAATGLCDPDWDEDDDDDDDEGDEWKKGKAKA